MVMCLLPTLVSSSLRSVTRLQLASCRMATDTASICEYSTLQEIRDYWYIREHEMAVKTAGAGRSKKAILADVLQLRLVRAYEYSCIARGQVFVAQSWLSRDLLKALRADARSLLERGAFYESGLTVASKDGITSSAGFPVEPEGTRTRLECNLRRRRHRASAAWLAPGEEEPSTARESVQRLVEMLRTELEGALGRCLLPDMEQFYSAGPPQAALGWHSDQYHEEMRNERRGDTRRSISWLLYLNEDGWDEPDGSGSGGAFRAFTRGDCERPYGAHEGNLQVGWLDRGGGGEPVFLDSWVVPPSWEYQSISDVRATLREEMELHYGECDHEELQTELSAFQPAYVLYCVDIDGRREHLSKPHEADSDDHLQHGDGTWRDDVPSLRAMLPAHLRSGFKAVTTNPNPNFYNTPDWNRWMLWEEAKHVAWREADIVAQPLKRLSE